MNMYDKLKVWIKALRAPFLTVTIIPVMLGSVVAWNETGNINWTVFLLALLGGVCVHLGLNLANDYFDHVSGNDEANMTPTPFSGGSRMIQNKLLPAKQIIIASLIFFGLGSVIGLYLNYVSSGNLVLIIGIIGIILAFFYTAPPLALGYRGFGEVFVGLGYGPLMVIGAYYVQTRSLSINPVWPSISIGILTALILYINEFPDYSADASVNKKTTVVILGKKNAMKLFPFILFAGYVITIIGIILDYIPVTALIVFLTLPLANKITNVLRKNYGKIYELLPANAGMIKLHLFFGILFSLSYLIDKAIFRVQ